MVVAQQPVELLEVVGPSNARLMRPLKRRLVVQGSADKERGFLVKHGRALLE